MNHAQLYSQIDTLLKSKESVIVAIDGNCGAGKTTLGAKLKEDFDCNVFHMDDFFLPFERKTMERLAEPGGNVDYERFLEEVILNLEKGDEFSFRPYCCKTRRLKEPITVQPKQLNIVEGSYSLHPTLVSYYQLKVFLAIDAPRQSQRILKRNGPEMHQRFIQEWIPLENYYFTELKIQEQCDIVIHA